MQKPAKIAEVDLTTRLTGGSETAFKYTLEGSLDGKSYTLILDNNKNWQVGFQILKIADRSPFRYLRLNVNRLINVHNGNSAGWADGICELTAFGVQQ